MKGCQPPRPQGSSERVSPERREEVQSGGAEGDGVGGEGLAQGGVWDDARPDPPDRPAVQC
jgi:hypothetical protein